MGVVVMVPARSGSSRLADKNVRFLGGMPLTAWSLLQASSLSQVDRVVFTSDSDDYDRLLRTAVCDYLGRPRDWEFVRRSASHSGTSSKIFDYVLDEWSRDLRLDEDDLLVSLLPTAPLRRKRTCESAIRMALESRRGVFTASRYDFSVSFAFRPEENGEWTANSPMSPMLTGNTRSQDQAEALHPNGGLTSMWGAQLAGRPTSFYEGSLYVEAMPQEAADVDTEVDFQRLSLTFGEFWDSDWGFDPVG